MKALLLKCLSVADFLLLPFVLPSAWLLKKVREAGVQRLPRCRSALVAVGVFPVRDHYYEPQFDHRRPRRPYSQERALPGIDWNVADQLSLLASMRFAGELADVPHRSPASLDFYWDNGEFAPGDAEVWYQILRLKKPRRLFEVGSGHSTRMAIRAIRKNREEDPGYACKHVCVEPYENPWLERTGVTVLRQRVEDVGARFFSELEDSDILFLDSSHIIRPDGDVLFEYLELLPSLRTGVIVHVHDIFSPRNYPRRWLEEEVKFWNEQYLVEAFLTNNAHWKVLAALNYLHHSHGEALRPAAPFITPDAEPGSLYLQKVAR